MPCGFAGGIAGLAPRLGWGAPCRPPEPDCRLADQFGQPRNNVRQTHRNSPPRLAYVSENQPPLEPIVRKVME